MTIKHIATIQTGLFAKPIAKGDVVYLQSKHFDEHGVLHRALHPDLTFDNITEKHLLKPGDVLFAAKGTKNFAAVFENHNPASVASTSFFVLRLTGNLVLPEFLAWFLNNANTQEFLKANARGTGIPSIRKSVLEELEIPVPSIEKQRLVVQVAALALKEATLRTDILNHRKKLSEQQLINAIK